MSRAGDWCPEHRNGYDDCSFLHRIPIPRSSFRLAPMPDAAIDDFDHGSDCLCPDPICRDWIETNAGRGFNSDGTPA